VAPNKQIWVGERVEVKGSQVDSMLKKRVMRDAKIEEYPSPPKSHKRDLRSLLQVNSQIERGDLRGKLKEQ
jgi:hypothetical protein